MKRRLLSLTAVIATLLVGMTAFAVSSWAASPPVWTVPSSGTESTHMNTNLNLVGALSVTSPQGHDLGVFIHSSHGSFQSTSNPNNNICPGGAIADGTFCSYNDPTVPQVNWNFRGTLAQVTQALNNVTYTPDLNFPQPFNATLIDTVNVSATEQNIAAGLTGSTTFEIEVDPPNQAPQFDVVPDPVNGVSTNANSVYDFLNQLDILDPGGYTCDAAQDAGRTLTVAVTQGTLNTTYVAAGFNVIGNGTMLLTMTGGTTDLNNAMDSMHYTPVPFIAYDDVVTLHTDDNGCVGYPGALVADAAFPLHVLPLAATHYSVTAPATATTGVGVSVVVTARDQYENLVPTYVGTAHLTSSDGAAVLGADKALVAGTASFSTTFNTVGMQTVTATDTVDASIFGTSTPVDVSAPQVATHFAVTAPASATAGSSFSITVTAEDASNATVTGYSGTVHFTSSDGAAVLPANATLVNGTGTFSVTYKTAGSQTVTATDTVVPAITGTSNTTAVSAAAASHFMVSAPASASTGAAFSFTVTALDQFNNTATAYAGTVHFTSSDGAAVLPANSTLVNGTGSFQATLNTTGGQTITGTDTVTAAITGTSASINVSSVPPGAATHFAVSAPASATAGTSFSITVTAQDASNLTAAGYAGTVHFTSSDGSAVLPANATLVNGTGTFSVTFDTAGSQTVTATDTVDPSVTGTSNATSVSAAAATHFSLSAPASANSGVAFSFTVTALDQFNNVDTGYAGTVHVTSSDGAAVLPADGTLTNGVGTKQATLTTAGGQTLTGTDTVTAAITGTSGTITVSAAPPGPATHFAVSAPAVATAGTSFSFTVTALDASNATATGYAGTAHFTSTDGAAVLPADAVLVNGFGTFQATLNTAGGRTITATDTVTAAITGTSASIVVSAAPPGAATHLQVSAPANATAGQTFSVTVTALDASNATATGYAGTVHFTSSDGQAVLPANAMLVNGVGTFQVTMKTSGVNGVSVVDTADGSITGVANVDVAPGAPSQMKVSPPPAGATAGVPFSFTVEVLDQFGNRVTSYAGTIHFSSDDPNAVLPADAVLNGGFGTFSATLTEGLHTLSAADVNDAQLNGTSVAAQVAAAITTTTTTTPGESTTTTSQLVLGATTTTIPVIGTLPVTGSSTGLLALFGVLLVAAGVVVLRVRLATR